MLEVHHITYDNLDLLQIGNERRCDVAVICHTCHEKAHNDQIFFVVPKTEAEYESIREIISNSKISNVNNAYICYLKNIKTKLCDIEMNPPSLTEKQSKQMRRKPKVYLVYKSNFKYNGRGFPILRLFNSKADAEQYIKGYPTIPCHYLKIKEMQVYQ